MRYSINDLLSEDIDFPIRGEKEDNLSVMFATTPRSGSTYMCHEFWKTGLFGAPAEYTNGKLCRTLNSIKTPDGFISYWKNIRRRRTTDNGVFSFKMFPYYFLDMIDRYGDAVSVIDFNKVIYLYRKDVIAQAISYARAYQTQRWFAEFPENTTPIYDFDLILKGLKFLTKELGAWERIFKKYSVQPHIICYEDFLINKETIIEESLNFLGVARSPTIVNSVPEITHQGDHINKIWKERFIFDLECKNNEYFDLLSRVNTGVVVR